MTYNNNNMSLSTDYVRIFVQLVEEKGILAKDILANTQIDPLYINKAPYISSLQLTQLIENSSQLLNDPDWGLQFGERLHTGAHGLLGHISTSASNSLESLKVHQQFLQIRNQMVSIDYQLQPQSVVIIFNIHSNIERQRRPIIDGCISGLISTLATKLQLKSVNIPIQFTYPKPDKIDLHKKLLGNHITFGSKQNSVELPLHLLTQPNASANPGVFHLVKQQSEAALAKFSQQNSLSHIISQHFLESPETLLTQENMAKKINMTPRTLRRRLLQEGVNYQEIQNSVRKTIAIQYLKSTSWTLQEISDRLGYSEEVNFSRAFKRWVGVSPSLFRHQNVETGHL